MYLSWRGLICSVTIGSICGRFSSKSFSIKWTIWYLYILRLTSERILCSFPFNFGDMPCPTFVEPPISCTIKAAWTYGDFDKTSYSSFLSVKIIDKLFATKIVSTNYIIFVKPENLFTKYVIDSSRVSAMDGLETYKVVKISKIRNAEAWPNFLC